MPRLGSQYPLVARAGEVTQLRGALSRARSGVAGAVLVSGDAGVGKSRLLAEAADIARGEGAHVLAGRCVDMSAAGFPYLPFAEIIDQVLTVDPGIMERRPALGTLVSAAQPEYARARVAGTNGSDEDTSARTHLFDQLQLFDAVFGALNDLAVTAAVLLEVEDLHWSDPSTRDLLSFLLSRLGDQPILVVASYRSDDLNRRHPLRPLLAELIRLPTVERLDLAPFDQTEAEAFVRTVAPTGTTQDLVVDVARRSEGNAFFAEELLAASAQPGAAIPTALADVLLTRVETLSPAAQRVVRTAAASGRWHLRHSTLEEVLGMDAADLEAALREAMQHNVLVSGVKDAYTFRHALLREAIYADLLPGERVRLHATYAELLARQARPNTAAALAYHSMNANDLPTALAASVRAAKEAHHKGALGAELQHIERALEWWNVVDDPETHAGTSELVLTRKAANAAGSAGHPERALAYMRTAVPLADARDDPVLSADARRQLTQTLLDNGLWTEAEEVISEAWELVKQCPPSTERAWVLAIRARVAAVDPQRRSFAEAAEADARAVGAAAVEADALTTLAFCENREGHPEESAALLERARQRADEAGALDVELRARFNLVVGRYEQGQLDTAAWIVDEAVDRAAEVGMTWSTYGRELRWLRAMVHYARGDWDVAAKAATPPGEAGSDLISALLAVTGTIIQVSRGELDTAERELTRLRPEWSRNEDEQVPLLAGIAGAELACWRNEPAAGVEVVDDALRTVRACSGDEWPMGGIRLAALALAAWADLARRRSRGDDPRAPDGTAMDADQLIEHVRQTVEHGEPRGATLGPEGRAWELRAEAEYRRFAGTEDAGTWRAVIDAFGYGDVYQQSMARWRLAELLIAAGRRDEAADALAGALSVAERLGAAPLVAAVRALARRGRIALPGAPTSSVDILTPRETAVLALVARGHTNRRVGEELFISEKTVSVHLSRVMSKLDAGSRTEAVAIAYQRGLLDEGEPRSAAEPAHG